jgi:hypothetical protein
MNVAFGNRTIGFYANHHPGGIDFFNNTAFRNPTKFNMLADVGASSHTLRNNIAMTPGTAIANLTGGADTFNTWSLSVTASAADFMGVAEADARTPRGADGSLPNLAFMHLAAGSDLIDKGTDVGLPFVGAAPDLGAFEFGATGGTTGTGGATGTGGRGGVSGTGGGGVVIGTGGSGNGTGGAVGPTGTGGSGAPDDTGGSGVAGGPGAARASGGCSCSTADGRRAGGSRGVCAGARPGGGGVGAQAPESCQGWVVVVVATNRASMRPTRRRSAGRRAGLRLDRDLAGAQQARDRVAHPLCRRESTEGQPWARKLARLCVAHPARAGQPMARASEDAPGDHPVAERRIDLAHGAALIAGSVGRSVHATELVREPSGRVAKSPRLLRGVARRQQRQAARVRAASVRGRGDDAAAFALPAGQRAFV